MISLRVLVFLFVVCFCESRPLAENMLEDNNKNQSPSHESNIGTSLNHEKHYNDQLRAHNESTESHPRLKPDFSTSTTKFLIEANHIPDENRIYPPNYPVTIMIEYPTYNYNDDNTKTSTRPPLRRPNISTKPPTKSTTSSMIVFPDEYSKMKEKNENSLQNNNEILSSMINSS